MAERLPAHLEAAGFLRGAEAAGGFGMVLKKGDPDRGALILIVGNRGEHFGFLERSLSPDGSYRWQRVGPGVAERLDRVGQGAGFEDGRAGAAVRHA